MWNKVIASERMKRTMRGLNWANEKSLFVKLSLLIFSFRICGAYHSYVLPEKDVNNFIPCMLCTDIYINLLDDEILTYGL